MSSGKTILVVDDSASVRRQLRLALEEAGLHVVEADNGEQGLAVARGTSVDLILADVNMPIMDGLEMITEMRALAEHKHTPIFVLTTESGAADARRGKELGATAWVVKPVKMELLVKAIRTLLKI